MQRWEYAVRNVAIVPTESKGMENLLNEMARDGWELDRTLIANTNPSVQAFIFRRPVASLKNEEDYVPGKRAIDLSGLPGK